MTTLRPRQASQEDSRSFVSLLPRTPPGARLPLLPSIIYQPACLPAQGEGEEERSEMYWYHLPTNQPTSLLSNYCIRREREPYVLVVEDGHGLLVVNPLLFV